MKGINKEINQGYQDASSFFLGGPPFPAPSGPVFDPLKVSFLILRVCMAGLVQTFFWVFEVFIFAYSDAK